jgi:hypothetical protein
MAENGMAETLLSRRYSNIQNRGRAGGEGRMVIEIAGERGVCAQRIMHLGRSVRPFSFFGIL